MLSGWLFCAFPGVISDKKKSIMMRKGNRNFGIMTDIAVKQLLLLKGLPIKNLHFKLEVKLGYFRNKTEKPYKNVASR
jgi:hypothetical protein